MSEERIFEEQLSGADAASGDPGYANAYIHTAFQQAPVAISVLKGPDFLVDMMNEPALKIWNIPQGHFLNKPLLEAAPQLQPELFSLLTTVYTNGTALSVREFPILISESPAATRYFNITFQPFQDSNGAIAGVTSIGTDITPEVLARKRIEESEKKYRSLFNSIDQGFCIIEMLYDEKGTPNDYRFLEANDAFEKHTGLVNAIGKTIKEMNPGHEQYWFDIYGRIASTGIPERFEQAATALGYHYEVYAFRMNAPEQHHVAVIFNDISLRKHNEDSLAFLADINNDLVRMTDPHKMISVLGEKIAAHFNAAICAFVEIQTESGRVDVIADWHQTKATRLVGTSPLSDFLSKDLLTLYTANELFYFNDAATNPRLNKEAFSRHGIASSITVPYRRNDQWMYALSIYDTVPRNWRKDETELMRELSNRIWTRFERIRAEDTLREAQQRQAFLLQLSDTIRPLQDPTEIQTAATRVLGEYLKVNRCYYWEMDVDGKHSMIRESFNQNVMRIDGRHRMDIYEDIWLNMIQGGKIVFNADVSTDPKMTAAEREMTLALQITSYFCVPLMKNSRFAAALTVTDSKPRQWSDQEIELVQETAERTWAAVERAKAEKALRESEEAVAQDLRNTQLLHHLSERLVSENNMQIFYQEIVKTAMALTKAHAGTVQILDEARGELVMLSSQGFEKKVTDHFYRVDARSNTSCGLALLKNERCFIDYDDPDAMDPDGSLKMHVDAGYLSAQSTPLVTRVGKPIGMVSTHWHHHHRPSERELRFLDLLARQAADILERKEREEKYLAQLENDVQQRTAEINKQKDFIETIINSTPDMVSAYDTEMRILAFNQSYELLFNVKKEQILGMRLTDAFPAAKNTQSESDLRRALNGESIHNQLFHSVITNRDYENYIIPLRDEHGTVYAAVAIAHDITEKNLQAKELELKNNELEKMNKELEAFTYISSHDLQEPLRKIQTFVGRIVEKERDNYSEMAKEHFVRIQNAASRMQTLIQDLLSFSRLATTERKPERAAPGKIIDDLVADFKEAIEAKNAAITTNEMGEVHIIPFQFRQLMHNLISNSLKFAKAEIPLRIDITAHVLTQEQPEFFGKNPVYHIRYTDNGIGFEPKFSERIFELFQKLHNRTEYAGTGIGLAIVKKIVENHNGIITATGELNKGARFDIYFPA